MTNKSNYSRQEVREIESRFFELVSKQFRRDIRSVTIERVQSCRNELKGFKMYFDDSRPSPSLWHKIKNWFL